MITSIIIAFMTASTSASQNLSEISDNESNYIYIVNDPDGFANLRSSPNLKSDVIGCIKSGTPIYLDDISCEKTGWCKIFLNLGVYSKSCLDSTRIYMEALYSNHDTSKAYIHESRLTKLSDLDTMQRISLSESSSYSIAKFTDFELRLSTKAFDRTKNRVTSGTYGETYVDGKYAWGTDGGTPTSETRKFEIYQSNTRIELNRKDFVNLFELHLEWSSVFRAPRGYFYILLHGSDGAGSYCVVLTIYNKRIISISPRLSVFV